MLYKKIDLELIVVADRAEALMAELNAVLDRLEEKHTIFGGGMEATTVKHPGPARKSALAHTMAAGEIAKKAAKKGLTSAIRAVI